MPEVQHEQALTDWSGDTPSLIAEMKRRAGVATDSELAGFMGVAQSTVSHWRNRGRIPESALLKFERIAVAGGEPSTARAMAARMVVMRVAEFWYQSALKAGAKGNRTIFYGSIAGSFHLIQDAVYDQLLKYEQQTSLSSSEVVGHLLDDEKFLEQVVNFAKEISMSAAMAREALSPPVVMRPPASN